MCVHYARNSLITRTHFLIHRLPIILLACGSLVAAACFIYCSLRQLGKPCVYNIGRTRCSFLTTPVLPPPAPLAGRLAKAAHCPQSVTLSLHSLQPISSASSRLFYLLRTTTGKNKPCGMIDFISSSTGLLKKNKTKSNAQAKGSSTPSTPDAHFYKRIKRTSQRTTYFYPFIKIELCCFPLGATTKRSKKI
jgi:hypothetical protein